MADFSALKTSIQNYIKQNGNEEITGNLLQQILLSMVTTLGDSAINDLVTALNAEIANRGNADTTLQGNIDNEATARGNADTELDGRITTLQGVVNGVIANVENGYVYAGIATPSSTPASGKVFYLALTAGTYTNFGATVVPQGINILKYNGSAWSLDSFLGLDDAPTQGSSNLVKSGGVLDSIIKDGSAFDLSAYNNGTTYADLSAALTALNALPAAYKKGGMSVKYVQSSDNKYVQYRLMKNQWSINTDDWYNDYVSISQNPETYNNELTIGDKKTPIPTTNDVDFLKATFLNKDFAGDVKSDTDSFYITDKNGYVVTKIDKCFFSVIKQVLTNDKSFYVTDYRGNIALKLNDSQLEIIKQVSTNDSVFYIVDPKGNIGFKLDSNGANFKNFASIEEVIETVNELVDGSKKTISCWGDSITAGTTTPTYPSWLQTLLGANFKVTNLGVGSAWLQDISARQGGVLAMLKTDIEIPASGSVVMNYNNVYNSLGATDFQLAPKYNVANSELAYNPVIMDNEKFMFHFGYKPDGVTWGDVTITRIHDGSAFTLKAGTPIIPNSVQEFSKSDYNVIFMGTNNTSSPNITFTTDGTTDGSAMNMMKNYHDSVIKVIPNTNYLIIGLFNISQRIANRTVESKTNEQILEQELYFEKRMNELYSPIHFINLRKALASQKAIDDAIRLGYMTQATATANAEYDAAWMELGCAAYSFMNYNSLPTNIQSGNDYTHPNAVGYKMIAYYVAERIKNLNI